MVNMQIELSFGVCTTAIVFVTLRLAQSHSIARINDFHSGDSKAQNAPDTTRDLLH